MKKNFNSDGRSIKIWGDEAVIHDTASGETHYLKPLMLALYQICRGHPGHTSNELAATLANRLRVANTSHFHELTEDTLNTLRKTGLLESA